MKICGVDEAGRGPVLGPLVICAAMLDKCKEKEMKELGVKDSKMLTAQKREQMYSKLKEVIKYKTIIVEPWEIDKCLNSHKSNLNWLEADKSIKLINELKPDIAYIDTPSPNINAYNKYISKKLEKGIKICCEHKADQKYPIASAASIMAKVTRDRIISEYKKKIGVETGTGYMSDGKTQKFLNENWEKYPKLFRTTWESYKKLVNAKKQKRLMEF